MVQIKLEDVKVEQIFLDEFSVSSKYNKHKGWSKIGEKGFVKLNYDSFSMFFIVALSEEKFYEIQWNNVMNSEDFIAFIKNIRRNINRNTQWCIVWDNASFHVSLQVNGWARNSGVAIIMISSYSPSLNPAEFWIAAVKAKIEGS